MNNNTPHAGPFPLRITKNDDQFVVITNQGNHYASTYDPAAARLISAAPDLLSALESAYNAIAWDIPAGNLSNEEEETLLNVIRAAIAKAKGEA
jgi:hypothetical protein